VKTSNGKEIGQGDDGQGHEFTQACLINPASKGQDPLKKKNRALNDTLLYLSLTNLAITSLLPR
jgi:hypothetical protein